MLKECAPGHTWEEKDHRIHVTYNGKRFGRFRQGPTPQKGSSSVHS